ncbi:hypothetical protein, partial [Mycobacterium avium]|uniref:hypothetical protein n=1 Tax=Mycobacterium avium TaxID=1764 RepID=UPI001F382075
IFLVLAAAVARADPRPAATARRGCGTASAGIARRNAVSIMGLQPLWRLAAGGRRGYSCVGYQG